MYVNIRNGCSSILFFLNAKENTVELLSTYEHHIQIPMLNLYYSEVGIANIFLSPLIANPLIYFRGPLNANPLIFIMKSAKR